MISRSRQIRNAAYHFKCALRDERDRIKPKTFRVFKLFRDTARTISGSIPERLIFCDEIAAATPEQAIVLCVRGVHGGHAYQYRAKEVSNG